MAAKKVFISYAHKDEDDEKWLSQTSVWLKAVEATGVIEVWDDRQIRPSDIWADEIRRNLASADFIIVLYSIHLQSSEYVTKVELPKALEAAKARGAKVYFLAVRLAVLEGPYRSLLDYQWVNKPQEPLNRLNNAARDEIFSKLASELQERAIETPLLPAPTPAPPLAPVTASVSAAVVVVSDPDPSEEDTVVGAVVALVKSAPAPPPEAVATPTEAPPTPWRRALLVINDAYDDPVYSGTISPFSDELLAGLSNSLKDEKVGNFEVRVYHNPEPQIFRDNLRWLYDDPSPSEVGLLYVYGAAVMDEGSLSFPARRSRFGYTQKRFHLTTLHELLLAGKTPGTTAQVILFDISTLYLTGEEEISDLPVRSVKAGFLGEGRFVMATSETTGRLCFPEDVTPQPPAKPRGPALGAAILEALETGEADVDKNKRVTTDEFMQFLERRVPELVPGRSTEIWAYDPSRAALQISQTWSKAFHDNQRAPGRDRAARARPMREPLLDVIVPTYLLDTDFTFLDWNSGFDLVVAEQLHLVRGVHNATEFVDALRNRGQVSRRSALKFDASPASDDDDHIEYPSVDHEELVFYSEAFGRIRFLKIAAQLYDENGRSRGWSVCLNVLSADKIEELWRRMHERLEEVVGSSRYSQVYPLLVTPFPEHQKLVKRMVELIGDARNVADLGAGSGAATSLLLAREDRVVYAVEINHVMLTHLLRKRDELLEKDRRIDERLRIIRDDIVRLDALPEGSLDAALMINVLYDVRDPFTCLQQVFRALKEGGRLVLSTPHTGTSVTDLLTALRQWHERPGATTRELAHRFTAAQRRHDHKHPAIQRYSIADLRDLLVRAGFEVLGNAEPAYVDSVVIFHARRPAAVLSAPAPDTRPSAPATVPPSATATASWDVFLCHSSQDADAARQVFEALKIQGISCWLSSHRSEGTEVPGQFPQVITQSRLMVLLLSERANESEYVEHEVRFAFFKKIPIVPIRIAPVQPKDSLYFFFIETTWLDAYPGPIDAHLARIADVVRSKIAEMAAKTSRLATT